MKKLIKEEIYTLLFGIIFVQIVVAMLWIGEVLLVGTPFILLPFVGVELITLALSLIASIILFI